jgi:hypothetical protein
MLPPPPGPPPGMMMPPLSRPPMLHSHQLPPPSGASSGTCRQALQGMLGSCLSVHATHADEDCPVPHNIFWSCPGPPPLYAAPMGGEGKKAPTITGQTTVPKMPRAQASPPLSPPKHLSCTCPCTPLHARFADSMQACAGGEGIRHTLTACAHA